MCQQVLNHREAHLQCDLDPRLGFEKDLLFLMYTPLGEKRNRVYYTPGKYIKQATTQTLQKHNISIGGSFYIQTTFKAPRAIVEMTNTTGDIKHHTMGDTVTVHLNYL